MPKAKLAPKKAKKNKKVKPILLRQPNDHHRHRFCDLTVGSVFSFTPNPLYFNIKMSCRSWHSGFTFTECKVPPVSHHLTRYVFTPA